MIIGHGIDLIEISRIKKAIESSDKFIQKVFTKKEIDLCEQKKDKYESYAVRYAAKEAFIKSLGTGLRYGIHWTDIEILSDSVGRPTIELFGTAMDLYQSIDCNNILVSLSHTSNTALASIILEQ